MVLGGAVLANGMWGSDQWLCRDSEVLHKYRTENTPKHLQVSYNQKKTKPNHFLDNMPMGRWEKSVQCGFSSWLSLHVPFPSLSKGTLEEDISCDFPTCYPALTHVPGTSGPGEWPQCVGSRLSPGLSLHMTMISVLVAPRTHCYRPQRGHE